MKTPRPLPEPLALVPFTCQQAVDVGVSRRRLRHRALYSPSRGIRAPGALSPRPFGTNLPDAVRPFTLVTEFSAASHATAFTFWSFPGFLPGQGDARIHISRPDTMAIPRRTGVVGHVGQFFEDEIVCVDGLLVTSRTRTWLERAGLPEAQLNVRTQLRDGVERQPDLAYPIYRVAVEYDGEGHSEAGQIVRDIAREEDFSRAGWLLVRISKRHMENDARLAVPKVRSALRDRGWTPN